MPSDDASTQTVDCEGGGVLVYTAQHHQRAAKRLVIGGMKADKEEMKQNKNNSPNWIGHVLFFHLFYDDAKLISATRSNSSTV